MTKSRQQDILSWYLAETANDANGAIARILPPSYPAYARVLNPVVTQAGERLTWADFAGGAVSVGGETQWSDILTAVRAIPDGYSEPETGTLDSQIAARLSSVLVQFTRSTHCLYLVWEGYAALETSIRERPTITNNMQRVMHVYRGRVDEAVSPIDFPANRIAMNWLAEDGAWCVGNDIYARSVFIGGSLDAIRSVLSEPGIEAFHVGRDHRIVPED